MSGKFDEEEKLLNYLKEITRETQKCLNENYVWVEKSVRFLSENIETSQQINFPKTTDYNIDRMVVKSKENLTDLFTRVTDKYIYFSVLTYVCAVVEDFFMKFYKELLCNSRFLLSLELIGDKKNELEYLLSKDKLDFKKLCKVFDCTSEIYLWDIWTEVKATRNAIVHNSGIIDELYLIQAKSYCRGELGSALIISDEYFRSVISSTKALVGLTLYITKELWIKQKLENRRDKIQGSGFKRQSRRDKKRLNAHRIYKS